MAGKMAGKKRQERNGWINGGKKWREKVTGKSDGKKVSGSIAGKKWRKQMGRKWREKVAENLNTWLNLTST